MARSKKVPGYQLHKASGQARVRIDGKDLYLGAYDSPESKALYQEICREWTLTHAGPKAKLTCNELALRYLAHAERYYVKNGVMTSEVHSIRLALRYLVAKHGKMLCVNFGPKALKSVRDDMIAAQYARESINKHVERIRRAFQWAVEQELFPADLWHALKAVKGLAKGRTAAVEPDPVMPVDEQDVDAIQPFCSRVIWAMVQTQKLTGMRPGEVVLMKSDDIDRSRDVWLYMPERHKTEHHGKQRVVPIGPQAQEVLLPFIQDDEPGRYLFSPRVARDEFDASRKANRKTPIWKSHEKRREGRKTLQLGEHYTVNTYRRAIQRACLRAEIKPWFPHQLRHSVATTIRRELGLEVARTVMGHSTASVTEIYAERDLASAVDAMRKFG